MRPAKATVGSVSAPKKQKHRREEIIRRSRGLGNSMGGGEKRGEGGKKRGS